jgi:hypothetical protein
LTGRQIAPDATAPGVNFFGETPFGGRFAHPENFSGVTRTRPRQRSMTSGHHSGFTFTLEFESDLPHPPNSLIQTL